VNILFLTIDDALSIHRWQVTKYGGDPGIRDRGLLEAALAMPQSGFGGEYLHDFPAGMAAAYLFHLSKNHPFVDGNKRVGLNAALLFLEVNGVTFTAPKEEAEALTLAVAAGEATKEQATEFFRKYVKAP
jgi:death-on-curing protein